MLDRAIGDLAAETAARQENERAAAESRFTRHLASNPFE